MVNNVIKSTLVWKVLKFSVSQLILLILYGQQNSEFTGTGI